MELTKLCDSEVQGAILAELALVDPEVYGIILDALRDRPHETGKIIGDVVNYLHITKRCSAVLRAFATYFETFLIDQK